jgi:hypothetical protein
MGRRHGADESSARCVGWMCRIAPVTRCCRSCVLHEKVALNLFHSRCEKGRARRPIARVLQACGAEQRDMKVVDWVPNMRMQLTRPRDRWPAAERWTSASLQLIRGR